MVWYALLFQNFPQFTVLHTIKGFGIVNKSEIDVFSGTLFPTSNGQGMWSELSFLGSILLAFDHFITPWELEVLT